MSISPILSPEPGAATPKAQGRSGKSAARQQAKCDTFSKPRIMVTPPQTCSAGFLPPDLFERVERLASELFVYDPAGKGMDGWHNALNTFRPNVIVSSWGIPPVPVDVPPELHYICHLCGAVRHWLPRQVMERGVLVTNWGSAISRTIAECTLMLTLCALRRVTQHTLSMHQKKEWDAAMSPCSLFGRRIGIHGFGNIARRFVELIRPFGCSISAFDPYVQEEVFVQNGVHRVHSLENLFNETQILVELAALTPETQGSITEALLRLLPSNGVFINTGRPQIVEPGALVRIAREGCLQIGLDVYDEEPLPKNDPLRDLHNVTLLPHIGGPTADHLRHIGEMAVRNIQNYIVGEELEALVTLDGYDRMT